MALPKTLEKLKRDPRIKGVEDHRAYGEGYWIYIKPPYWSPDMESRTIHEYNVADVMTKVRNIEIEPGATVRVRNPAFKTGPGAKSIKEKKRGVVAQSKERTYVVKASGKKRGVVNNPTNGRNYRKAVRLYQDFTGENPKFVDEWSVEVPDHAMQVGRVTGVMYIARVDGKNQEFLHEFTGKSRPILAASADGRQLLLLGGDYKMTERGIVDGTYEIRR